MVSKQKRETRRSVNLVTCDETIEESKGKAIVGEQLTPNDLLLSCLDKSLSGPRILRLP